MVQMADTLRRSGHTVHTPDYYDGHVFTDTAAGIAYRDRVTFPELARRAAEAVAALPLSGAGASAGADKPGSDQPVERSVVFGGFSLGAAMAQSFGKRSPLAVGALLFHAGGVPKPTSWQQQVPVQIHHSVDDPWIEPGQPETLVHSVAAAGATASHFVYPGGAHLFADATTDDYDEHNADLLWRRVLQFLDTEVLN